MHLAGKHKFASTLNAIIIPITDWWRQIVLVAIKNDIIITTVKYRVPKLYNIYIIKRIILVQLINSDQKYIVNKFRTTQKIFHSKSYEISQNLRGIVTFQVTIMFELSLVSFSATILNFGDYLYYDRLLVILLNYDFFQSSDFRLSAIRSPHWTFAPLNRCMFVC